MLDIKNSERIIYARCIPPVKLPTLIEIDSRILPDPWADFCAAHTIRPFGVSGYDNPLKHMKLWGMSGIFRDGVLSGDYCNIGGGGERTDTAIDSTSGNAGDAGAWILFEQIRKREPRFPIKHFKTVMPKTTPDAKVQRLISRGAEPVFAENSIEAMELARNLAKRHGYWHLNQHRNPANSRGYEPLALYTARHLPYLGLMSCGVGTGGSCSCIMKILVEVFTGRLHDFRGVAVVAKEGEPIDGVRSESALTQGTLPWREAANNNVQYVGLADSLKFSAALWQQAKFSNLWCEGGPSTGFSLFGGLLALKVLADTGELELIRHKKSGAVFFAFLAPDMRTPYKEKYAEHNFDF